MITCIVLLNSWGGLLLWTHDQLDLCCISVLGSSELVTGLCLLSILGVFKDCHGLTIIVYVMVKLCSQSRTCWKATLIKPSCLMLLINLVKFLRECLQVSLSWSLLINNIKRCLISIFFFIMVKVINLRYLLGVLDILVEGAIPVAELH